MNIIIAIHASCLGLAKAFGLFSQWFCNDCSICNECESSTSKDTFLVNCPSCDKYYHCPSCIPKFEEPDEGKGSLYISKYSFYQFVSQLDPNNITWNCSTCVKGDSVQETKKSTDCKSSTIEEKVPESVTIEEEPEESADNQDVMSNKRVLRKRKVNSRYYSDNYTFDSEEENPSTEDDEKDDNYQPHGAEFSRYSETGSLNQIKSQNKSPLPAATWAAIEDAIITRNSDNRYSTSAKCGAQPLTVRRPQVVTKAQHTVKTPCLAQIISRYKCVRPSVVQPMELSLASRQLHEHVDPEEPKIIHLEDYKNKKTPSESSNPSTSSNASSSSTPTKATAQPKVVHYLPFITRPESDASQFSLLYKGHKAIGDKLGSSQTLIDMNQTKPKLPQGLPAIKVKRRIISSLAGQQNFTESTSSSTASGTPKYRIILNPKKEFMQRIERVKMDNSSMSRHNAKRKRIVRCLRQKYYERPNLTPIEKICNPTAYMNEYQSIGNFSEIGIDYYKKVFHSPEVYRHSLLHHLYQQKQLKFKNRIKLATNQEGVIANNTYSIRFQKASDASPDALASSSKSILASGPSTSGVKKIVLAPNIVSSLLASGIVSRASPTISGSTPTTTTTKIQPQSQSTKATSDETVAVKGSVPMMGNFTIKLPVSSSATTTTTTTSNSNVVTVRKVLLDTTKSAQPAGAGASPVSVYSYKINSDGSTMATTPVGNSISRFSLRMAKPGELKAIKSNSDTKLVIPTTSGSAPITVRTVKISNASLPTSDSAPRTVLLKSLSPGQTKPSSASNVQTIPPTREFNVKTITINKPNTLIATTTSSSTIKTITSPGELKIIGNKALLAAYARKKLAAIETERLNQIKIKSVSGETTSKAAEISSTINTSSGQSILSPTIRAPIEQKAIIVRNKKNDANSKLIELNDQKSLVRTVHVSSDPLEDDKVAYNQEMMVVSPSTTIVNKGPFDQTLILFGLRYILRQGIRLELPTKVNDHYLAQANKAQRSPSLTPPPPPPSSNCPKTISSLATVSYSSTASNQARSTGEHSKDSQAAPKNAKVPKLPPRRILPNMKPHEVELIEILLPALSPAIHGGRRLMNFKIPRQKVHDFLLKQNAEIIRVKNRDNIYELAPRKQHDDKEAPSPPPLKEETEKDKDEIFPPLQNFDSDSECYNFTPYFTVQIDEDNVADKMLDLSTLGKSLPQLTDVDDEEDVNHLSVGPNTLITNHMNQPTTWKIDGVRYVIRPKQRFFISTYRQQQSKLNFKEANGEEDDESAVNYNQVAMSKKPKLYELETYDGLVDTFNVDKLKSLKEKCLADNKSQSDAIEAYKKARHLTKGAIQSPKNAYLHFELNNRSNEVTPPECVLQTISADKAIEAKATRLVQFIQKPDDQDDELSLSCIKTPSGYTTNSMDLSNIEIMLPQQLTLDRFQILSQINADHMAVVNVNANLSDDGERADISYHLDDKMSGLFYMSPCRKIRIPKENCRRVDNEVQVQVTEAQKEQLFAHLKPNWKRQLDKQRHQLKRKQELAQKRHERASKRFSIHAIDYDMGVTYVEATVQGRRLRMELKEFKDYLVELRNEFEETLARKRPRDVLAESEAKPMEISTD